MTHHLIILMNLIDFHHFKSIVDVLAISIDVFGSIAVDFLQFQSDIMTMHANKTKFNQRKLNFFICNRVALNQSKWTLADFQKASKHSSLANDWIFHNTRAKLSSVQQVHRADSV